MPYRPGITVLPVASMTRAPAGAGTRLDGPSAVMRRPVMTTVWSSATGAPVPSMTRTWVRAVTPESTAINWRIWACCCAPPPPWAETEPASTADSAKNEVMRRMEPSDWRLTGAHGTCTLQLVVSQSCTCRVNGAKHDGQAERPARHSGLPGTARADQPRTDRLEPVHHRAGDRAGRSPDDREDRH